MLDLLNSSYLSCSACLFLSRLFYSTLLSFPSFRAFVFRCFFIPPGNPVSLPPLLRRPLPLCLPLSIGWTDSAFFHVSPLVPDFDAGPTLLSSNRSECRLLQFIPHPLALDVPILGYGLPELWFQNKRPCLLPRIISFQSDQMPLQKPHASQFPSWPSSVSGFPVLWLTVPHKLAVLR